MIIDIPVSFGELIDKITILKIKTEKIKNIKKSKIINFELTSLNKVYKDYYNKINLNDKSNNNKLNNLNSLHNNLYQTNKELWEIEDLIRDKERNKEFDAKFIGLARSVYITNDKRMKYKNDINILMDSTISEQKSYKPY